MATIDELIQQQTNPFDAVTFKTGNFWQEHDQVGEATVDSIHQAEIQQVIQILRQVATDHRTRAVLLAGDPGSGKSYVLKRLKQNLSAKAFFVYIPPFVDRDFIWRHTLRQTVDSLMHTPVGQRQSQLLLWLKSLSVFSDLTLLKRLLGERSLFVKKLTAAYPSVTYQTKEFLGVLYDLTQPDLYATACNWLRGEDLDEDDLKALKVKKSIDSEATAQGILANLGKISTSTFPIVLCFDQVESKLLPDGSADIQPVFMINTTFHNESLKNFLIIISIVTHTWRQNSYRIQQSDKDRVDQAIALKPINLEQAEAIWISRLYQFYRQANPQPESKIYPLTQAALTQTFPGGKTNPRQVLVLGQKLFDKYKAVLMGNSASSENAIIDDKRNPLPSFKLLWEQELKKTAQKVSRIRHFSESELISMLGRSLVALKRLEIQPKLLPSPTYASHSLAYQEAEQNKKVGVVWAENPSQSFFHTMKACEKVELAKTCRVLYLIRAEAISPSARQTYGLYKKFFMDRDKHIKPDLESVHDLATYDRLVNSVYSHELVLAGQVIKPTELQALIRDSGVFKNCRVLQDLGIVPKLPEKPTDLTREKEFFLNLVKTQYLIGHKVAIENTVSQFPRLNDTQIQRLIQELCQTQQISILDERAPFSEQIICLVPSPQPSK
jgi:AAA ATPase domain